MRAVFRVDASKAMGSGHVVRAATLAQGLVAAGWRVSFLCRAHPGHMADWLGGRGFEVDLLPPPGEKFAPGNVSGYAVWLGASAEEDAAQCRDKILSNIPDWLVVDHYAIDAVWEKLMRPAAGKIFVIDDLADRGHDCDLLLDQNFRAEGAGRYDNLVPKDCVVLAGPRYALLRPEFLRAREKVFPRDRVVVFFGAVDPFGMTARALDEVMPEINGRNLKADVVIGGLVGEAERRPIREACGKHAGVTCHEGFADMAGLLARCRLFVGAGGTTTWERSLFGIPAVVVGMAGHQDPLAREFAGAGAQLYLGRAEEVRPGAIGRAVGTLLDSAVLSEHLGKTAAGFVDGLGLKRVITELSVAEISLREAVEADCAMLHSWRDHADTRRYFHDPRSVPFDEHKNWFLNALRSPDKFILVGAAAGRPVGAVRVDVESGAGRVSIYLDPTLHGRGHGRGLLRETTAWVRRHRPGITKLKAEILARNEASRRAFEKAGYRRYASVYERDLRDEN